MDLDFFKEYVRNLETRGRMDTTIKRYIYDFDDFFSWVQERKGQMNFEIWKKLNSNDYQDYFNSLYTERKFNNRSLKRVFVVLNGLKTYYQLQGIETADISLGSLGVRVGKHQLEEKDFVKEEEIERLLRSIPSEQGLSKVQIDRHPKMVQRNIVIVKMFLYDGLTLSELVNLKMTDLNFIRKFIDIRSGNGRYRRIYIPDERMAEYYAYLTSVPESVRPRNFTDDPFFVAFHFRLGTYMWSYEDEKPKNLTEISVERMLQKEVRRSGLSRKISPQMLRNTCIVEEMMKGTDKKELLEKFGFKAPESLNRYYKFADKMMNV